MKSVLTVVEQVSYQSQDGTPVSAVTRYSLMGQDPEQPYERRIELDTNGQWVPLDVGWFRRRGCRLLILTNISPQRKRLEMRLGGVAAIVPTSYGEVQMRFGGGAPGPVVPVGEGCRFRPACVDTIEVWTAEGAPARIALTLFP